MGTTVGEIAMGIALLKEPQEPLCKPTNVVRNTVQMNLQNPQEVDEPIFDRSQDALFERLGRPAFRHVPTHRQPIRELALGLLIATFPAPTDGSDVEGAAAAARSRRSVHTVPTLRFVGLVEE
jgi:hypothetical protein